MQKLWGLPDGIGGIGRRSASREMTLACVTSTFAIGEKVGNGNGYVLSGVHAAVL